MTIFRSCLAGVGIVALIALLMLANAAFGAEAYCNACAGDSGWSGAKALDQIGNPNAGTTEVMSGLSTAQKNRVGIWKQPLAGFASDNATDEDQSSSREQCFREDSTQQKPWCKANPPRRMPRSCGAPGPKVCWFPWKMSLVPISCWTSARTLRNTFRDQLPSLTPIS